MTSPEDLIEQRQQRTFTRRAMLLGVLQTAGLGLVGGRLYQLQVTDGLRYAPLAEENRINLQVIAPERGRILDRYGTLLAGNEDAYRAVVVPALAGELGSLLGRLARLVPLAPEEQVRLLARARRSSRHAPLIVPGELDLDQVAAISLRAPELPGVSIETVWRRRYFHGATVGHVVGYVGSVERRGLGDDPLLRIPGARVGKAGVELGLETSLRGEGGAQRLEVDARGRIVRTLERIEPRSGHDVVLTIDTQLQALILERLAKEGRGAAVVMDVAGGEVIALASTPTYDPTELVGGVSPNSWRGLRNAINKPLFNRAVSGLYPPGSTFKLVTALAALKAGVVGATDKIRCDGTFQLGNKTFRCWKKHGHGSVDMHRALTESCDVYFYEMARRMGSDPIASMARALGYGQTYKSGMALQKPGVVPTAAWKVGQLERAWFGGETVLTGIGQGYVLATPMQLAVMTARIATGRAVSPTFVRPTEAGKPPKLLDRLPVSEEWLDLVRRGMHGVVNEAGGTGANAALDGGPAIAGKTGTSQVSRASIGRESSELAPELRDHALFVAYVPSDKPRYAVAAIIEHGGSGGTTAAPLVRDVIKEVLKADPLAKPAYPGTSGVGSVPRGEGSRNG